MADRIALMERGVLNAKSVDGRLLSIVWRTMSFAHGIGGSEGLGNSAHPFEKQTELLSKVEFLNELKRCEILLMDIKTSAAPRGH